MIRTRDEFEDGLERVLAWLADPPQPGTAEDAAFNRLLQDLAGYHASAPPPAPDDPLAGALAGLERELADFRRRHPDRPVEGAFSGFGFGRDLGPR